MLVYLVALAQALVYLAAVPVCAAFCVTSRDGLRAGSAVGVFRAKKTLLRARRAMHAPRRKGKKPALRRALAVLRRVQLGKIALRGTLALGDAAATALACGALTSLAASLLPRAESLEIRLTPDFSGDLRLEIQGMIRVRAGQIILAAAHSGIDEIRGRIAHGKAPD